MDFETDTAPVAPAPVAPVPTTAQSGQIFIKTLQGESLPIDYNGAMKIGDLKNMIHSERQIPVDQQRLIFQGKQLEDDNTLADYNIETGSNIHLVLRVKGGF